MNDLNNEPPKKIMAAQISPYVFTPSELKELMKLKNGINSYVYNYGKINDYYTGVSPLNFETLTKQKALDYIKPILNIAINEGISFLKKLTPEFSLYQIKEYGKDFWIENNWIADIERYLKNKKKNLNQNSDES
ncbi:hypothetical protein [Aquimarina sp. Aq78]|uniref:hypothetical protein n=1 Tax=Aquimarina sp. Aq78 TaxID=1191889 RepID=UPI00131C6891|nr:hypothetical protein [Aquimarina sp. Aq78]